MSTQTQAVTFGGFKSIEDKEFYERSLIQPSRDEHILGQFLEKKTLPKHHGKTISFRKAGRITPNKEPLVEGILPAPNDFEIFEFSTTIQRYGDWIKYSDESIDFSIDDMFAVISDEMGWAFKDFLEEKQYELMSTSTNRWFAGVTSKPAEATLQGYKNAITKEGIVLSDLPKIAAFFSRNKVQSAKQNDFVMLVSPEIAAELQSLKKSAENEEYSFIELQQQQQNPYLYKGTEGKILRFLIVSTPTIKPDEDGYYNCIVLGKVRGKWGTSEISLEGENAPKVINKPIGSSGVLDALDQVGSFGWKVKGYGGLVTHPEAVLIYTCKSSLNYSSIDETNRNGIIQKVEFVEGVGTTNTKLEQEDIINGGMNKE